MSVYDKFIKTAQVIIEKKGRLIKLKKLSAELVDETKPWLGSGIPTIDDTKTITTKGVFLPPEGSGLGKDFVTKDLLKTVSQIVLVANYNDVDLTKFDILEDNQTDYKISFGKVLSPGDKDILYAFGILL